jgi:hypothetical protein
MRWIAEDSVNAALIAISDPLPNSMKCWGDLTF